MTAPASASVRDWPPLLDITTMTASVRSATDWKEEEVERNTEPLVSVDLSKVEKFHPPVRTGDITGL